MEPKEQASVNINLQEGHIEASGSEIFVEKILSEYMSKLEQYLQVFPQKQVETERPALSEQKSSSFEEPVQALDTQMDKNISEYIKHGIYHNSNGEMTLIVSHLPGKNNSAKMQKLLLLMGFIAKDHRINVTDFKSMAKKHSCLDSSNFAAILKRNSNLFLPIGKGKNQQIELTFPGLEEAHKLLDTLTNKDEKQN